MFEFSYEYFIFDSMFDTKTALNSSRRKSIESLFEAYNVNRVKNCIIIQSEDNMLFGKIEEYGYFLKIHRNIIEKGLQYVENLNNILSFTKIPDGDILELGITSNLIVENFKEPLEQSEIIKKIIQSESKECILSCSYIDTITDNGPLVKNEVRCSKDSISITTSSFVSKMEVLGTLLKSITEYIDTNLKSYIRENIEE